MGAGERVEEAGEELRENPDRGGAMSTCWWGGVPVLGHLRTLPGVQGLHPGRKGSRSPESAPGHGGEGDHNIMDAFAIP